MTTEIVLLLLACAISITVALALTIADDRWDKRVDRARLDVADARRQSHALGLPFPEADGTLSFPPPTPEQVHADLHARRWAAERGRLDLSGPVVARGEIAQVGRSSASHIEAAETLARELRRAGTSGDTWCWSAPGTATWHVEDCRCLRAGRSGGWKMLAEDDRCRALRTRS